MTGFFFVRLGMNHLAKQNRKPVGKKSLDAGSLVLNPLVDRYLAVGCGRCALVGTPQCKVHRWKDYLEELRNILLEEGLKEELKWSMPCYTYNNNNVAMLAAFKEYCSVSFFKGVLLTDKSGILSFAGENSRSAKLLRIHDLRDVKKFAPQLRELIREAIALEKQGAKVDLKTSPLPTACPEFIEAIKSNPALKKAFYSLTPGRQRGYLLHFSAAKQAATRRGRIEKYSQKILAGKGMLD